MTGYGEARRQHGDMTVTAEARAVNNRHFKLVCRINDPYDAIEPEVERHVRARVRRGTVLVTLRVERPKRPDDYRLNLVALESYRRQLAQAAGGVDSYSALGAILSLPGVVEDRTASEAHPHDDWPLIEPVVTEALDRFHESRAQEGRAMAEELLSLGRQLAAELERVVARVPEVVAGYQHRLLERVQSLVKDRVVVEPKDLIREVAILAERADVAEEVTRLRAHIQQCIEVIQGPESAGRKLEFVVQEMGRETNTIGSKANDVAISRSVVEMKGALEKIRELIQNVE
jgi:uncharacterized protein (TIGR00255 family)